MKIRYAARSHVGRVRENNEDNLFLDGLSLPLDIQKRSFSVDGLARSPAVLAVCDGMGGEEAGETASQLAVDTLAVHREQLLTGVPLDKAVQSYVTAANHAIYQTGLRRSGTTLALAVIRDRAVYCFNMGDSRIYALRRNRFWQVTHDHTLAEERRQLGETNVQGLSHILTRCIGIGGRQEAEGYPALAGGLRLLICSDGLKLPPEQLRQLLSGKGELSGIADALLAAALEAGGSDNVTLIVADVERAPLFSISQFGFMCPNGHNK